MPKSYDEIKDIQIKEVELTLEELKRKVEETERLLAEADALHDAYGRVYAPDDRPVVYGQGLVHSPEEAESIDAILNTCEACPHYVQSLAKQDGGEDDAALEVPLLHARLEAVKYLQAAAQRAQNLANLLFDTAASIGLNAKPVSQAAYRILKPLSATDTKVQKILTPALNFHRDKSGKRAPKTPKP